MASYFTYTAVCGSLGEGSPPLLNALLEMGPWMLRLSSAFALILQFIGLPLAFVFCEKPLVRVTLCIAMAAMHSGIRLTMNIDFWPWHCLFISLVEWTSLLPVNRAALSKVQEKGLDPLSSPCKGAQRGQDSIAVLRRGEYFFLIIAGSVLMLQTHHNMIKNTDNDYLDFPPLMTEPRFGRRLPNFDVIGQWLPCDPCFSLWNLQLTFEPPMAGFTKLDAFNDLVPHHEMYYVTYNILLQRAMLGDDPQWSLRHLKMLLELLRVRLEPTWTGTSVGIVAEARHLKRDTASVTDLGKVRSRRVQRFVVRAQGPLGRPLFLGPGGRAPRAPDPYKNGNPWEVLVCGQPVRTAAEARAVHARYLRIDWWPDHPRMWVPQVGLECLQWWAQDPWRHPSPTNCEGPHNRSRNARMRALR